MSVRSAQTLAYVVAAILCGCVSASASIFLNPSPTSNPLVAGDVYDTGSVTVAGSTSISVDYLFTVTSAISSQSIATTFHPDGSGSLGIDNASLQWYEFNGSTYVSVGPSGFLQVSDASGVETSLTPTLNFLLTSPPGMYELLFSGTTESNGGNYDLSVTALGSTREGQTPLPGALALFGSALAGSGFLMRRRKNKPAATV
jgi:hypothetical protein